MVVKRLMVWVQYKHQPDKNVCGLQLTLQRTLIYSVPLYRRVTIIQLCAHKPPQNVTKTFLVVNRKSAQHSHISNIFTAGLNLECFFDQYDIMS